MRLIILRASCSWLCVAVIAALAAGCGDSGGGGGGVIDLSAGGGGGGSTASGDAQVSTVADTGGGQDAPSGSSGGGAGGTGDVPVRSDAGGPGDADTGPELCVPDCAGKVCGADGCGGSCGACAEGSSCAAGQCVVGGPTCGDGSCDAPEDCGSCEGDCGECPFVGCGDGSCEGDESCSVCPVDCGECPGGDLYCFEMNGCIVDGCGSDLVCQQENLSLCLAAATTPAESSTWTAWQQCLSGCGGNGCLLKECAPEYGACLQGSQVGSGSCGDLYACISQCQDPADAGECQRSCAEQATQVAAVAYGQVMVCYSLECSAAPDQVACSDQAFGPGGACAPYWAECSGGSLSPVVGYGGWVSELSMEDTSCCFDYDDDGEADNGLATLLSTASSFLGQGASFDDQLAEILAEGSMDIVLQVVDGHLLGIAADSNAPLAWKQDGEAPFWSVPGSDGKARIVLDVPISQSGSTFSGSGGSAGLLEGIGFAGAALQDVRVTGTLTDTGAGIYVADGQLGAVLPLEAVATTLSLQMAGCDCLDLSGPAFEVPSEGKLACSDELKATGASCLDSESGLCAQFAGQAGLFCGVLGAFGPDLDSDGNGTKDAFTLGYRFTAVPAEYLGVGQEPEGGWGGSPGCAGGTSGPVRGVGLVLLASLALIATRRRS